MTTAAAIDLDGVSRIHATGLRALDDISLSIRPGERVVVLGPSGSGKTTLLRLIAGLDVPQVGTVRIGGREMSGVPPHERDLAMVFQSQSLYPHLSVAANLEFSMRARRVPRQERRSRVHEVAGLLSIEGLLSRRPSELSGGERQRVALGRAVARRPGVLLLDEPFANLDEPLRVGLRTELLDLHRRVGSTLVMVTHDQAEALAVGQRLAVLHRGKLLQIGPPDEVYDRPAHRQVAAFVGSPGMNLLRCELIEAGETIRIVPDGCAPIDTQVLTGLWVPSAGSYELGIRAEMVRVHRHIADGRGHGGREGELLLPAELRSLEYRGASALVALRVGGQTLHAHVERTAELLEGQALAVSISLSDACWFDLASGRRVSQGKALAC